MTQSEQSESGLGKTSVEPIQEAIKYFGFKS